MLAVSIAAEIVATLSLKAADGLTRPGPVVLVVLGYGTAFWLMSTTMSALPVAFVYAVWSGVGMIGAAVGGVVLFGERVDLPLICGIGLIMAGVTVLAATREYL